MVRAQTPRVFEEHVCFALVHFAEDDDVVWVLMGISVQCRKKGKEKGEWGTYNVVFIRNIIVMQRFDIQIRARNLRIRGLRRDAQLIMVWHRLMQRIVR
jgi:hypothetical protein